MKKLKNEKESEAEDQVVAQREEEERDNQA